MSNYKRLRSNLSGWNPYDWHEQMGDDGMSRFEIDIGDIKGETDVKSWKQHPVHPPTKVLHGKDNGGWALYVGERWECKKRAPEFDMILNLCGDSIAVNRFGHHFPPKFTTLQKYNAGEETDVAVRAKEIMIDWPNMMVPAIQFQFWVDLYKVMQTMPKTLMFCLGGHGRTGTGLALMLVVSGAEPDPDKAMEWIRKNYCHKCIESASQERLVRDFGRWIKNGAGDKGKG